MELNKRKNKTDRKHTVSLNPSLLYEQMHLSLDELVTHWGKLNCEYCHSNNQNIEIMQKVTPSFTSDVQKSS